jgi:putative ABC transport system permease protein
VNILAGARIAVRALRVNKLRSILTMLGIIMGVAAVIAMISVGSGAQARIAEQIQSLGASMLVVLSGSSTSGGVRLGAGSQLTITEARDWPVAAGQAFAQEAVDGATKVAVLGETVARNLFADSDPIGQVIRIKKVPFTVVGILGKKGQTTWGQDQDDVILVPLSTAKRKLLGVSQANARSVGAISVKVREGEDMKDAETQTRELLRQRHRLQPYQDDDFNIRNLAEYAAAQEESSRVMTILLAAIASVSLLVGGIGIMNIMLVSVTERTREIGLRMAVGARGRDILMQFLVEAVTLSLIGGTIGVVVGLVTSYTIPYFAGWRTLVRPEAIVIAFGFAAAIGIFFGFYPARKAASLNPIEALRYE